MPLEFLCPQCNRTLRVPDGSEGRGANCPACGNTTVVPGAVAAANFGDAAPVPGPAANGNPFGDGAIGNAAPSPARAEGPVNPYAAPAVPPPAAFTPEAGKIPLGELRLCHVEFSRVMGHAWEIMWNRFGDCAIMGLTLIGLYLGMNIAGRALEAALQSSDRTLAAIFAFAWQLGSQVVHVWLQMGMINFGLVLARTGRASVGNVFSAGPYFMRGLGITILAALASISVLLVAAFPAITILIAEGGPDGVAKDPGMFLLVAFVGGTIGMAVFAWVTLRWKMAYEFVIDRDAGVLQAMSLSAKFMYGNKMAVFLIQLATSLLMLAAVILTCCVGAIFTYPFMGILSAVIYLAATGQPYGAFLPSQGGGANSASFSQPTNVQ